MISRAKPHDLESGGSVDHLRIIYFRNPHSKIRICLILANFMNFCKRTVQNRPKFYLLPKTGKLHRSSWKEFGDQIPTLLIDFGGKWIFLNLAQKSLCFRLWIRKLLKENHWKNEFDEIHQKFISKNWLLKEVFVRSKSPESSFELNLMCYF